MSAHLRKYFAGYLVLIISFLLRFLPVCHYNFWYDELSGINRTFFSSFAEIIEKGVKPDAHPALLQVLLYYWIKLVGYNDALIKLPFLLSGYLSCVFLYRFCIRFFDYKTALVSATIMGFSLIFLVYGSYARMYSPGILFCVLTLHYTFSFLQNEVVKKTTLILLVLFATLALYTHHLSGLFVLSCLLVLLIHKIKINAKALLLVCISVFVLYLPELPITLKQSGYSIASWLGTPKWNVLFGFIKTVLGTGYVYLIVTGFSFLGFMNIHKKEKTESKVWLLLFLFLFNFLIIYFYSILRNPLFQYSGMLFSAPCLLVCAGYFISRINGRWFYFSLSVLGVFMLVQNIFIKQYYSFGLGCDYPTSLEKYLSLNKKYGEEKVTLLTSDKKEFYNYYKKKYNIDFPVFSFQDSVLQNHRERNLFLANMHKEILVLSNPNGLELADALRFFPYFISQQEGYFENCIVLSKNKTSGSGKSHPFIKNEYSLKTGLKPFVPEKKEGFSNAGYLETTEEYPLVYTCRLSDLKTEEGDFIVASVDYKQEGNIHQPEMVFSIDDEGKNIRYASNVMEDISDSTGHFNKCLYMGNECKDYPEAMLKFFVWNKGGKKLSLKNFSIRIISPHRHQLKIWE